MISKSGGVTTQIHNDKVYRENQVTPDRAAAEKQTGNTPSGVYDKISLSAEALALARSGALTAATGAQEQGEEPPGPPRLLDVRV